MRINIRTILNQQFLLKGLLVLFFCLTTINLHSQYNKNWIIGDGLFLTFENGRVKEIPGNLPGLLHEAGTTVSDEDGKLLFYAENFHVYDFRYQIITPTGSTQEQALAQ
jgi:hypothetical protein